MTEVLLGTSKVRVLGRVRHFRTGTPVFGIPIDVFPAKFTSSNGEVPNSA